MKRFFSFIFGFVILLSAMLICFLPTKNSTKRQADASEVIEQKYYDESSIELVSKNLEFSIVIFTAALVLSVY